MKEKNQLLNEERKKELGYELDRIINVLRKDIKIKALRYFMWVEIVKWLQNNPKSEEQGGGDTALNLKGRGENVGKVIVRRLLRRLNLT